MHKGSRVALVEYMQDFIQHSIDVPLRYLLLIMEWVICPRDAQPIGFKSGGGTVKGKISILDHVRWTIQYSCKVPPP